MATIFGQETSAPPPPPPNKTGPVCLCLQLQTFSLSPHIMITLCVCVCVCVCARARACVCARARVCMYIYVCANSCSPWNHWELLKNNQKTLLCCLIFHFLSFNFGLEYYISQKSSSEFTNVIAHIAVINSRIIIAFTHR